MLRSLAIPGVAALLVLTAACDSGRHSAAGFRLPNTGDVERGKAAFLALECQKCHEVSGMNMPKPTVQPAVPVVLGGEVTKELSDGYLVTSIIHPSYKLASFPKSTIAVGDRSRMPEYADNLTVRQLTDVVAFLQSRYIVRPVSAKYPGTL